MTEPLDHTLTTRVNGRAERALVQPRTTLAEFLRDYLGLTGTHVGCEQGACGACTVIVDGAAIRSCLMFAVQVEGAEVQTVEGLSPTGHLSALQESFSKYHALQCGFCTAGFLMTVSAALSEGDDLTHPAQARARISGNLCRCTGYTPIVDAVVEVARAYDGEGEP